jgi:DNA-binding CsgD family transcriptional regulator
LLAALGGGEMLRSGDRARALELAWRAWGDGRYLDELGPDDPSLSAITGVLAPADAFDRAEEVATATIVRAREIGSLTAFASFSYVRGTARHFRGALADAISDLEAAREAEASGWEQYVAAARWQLVLAAMARGDLDRARSAARLSPVQEEQLAANPTFAGLLVARGALALHDGDPLGALTLFEESGRLQGGMGLLNPALFGWRTYAAEACLRLGRSEQAQDLARADLELADAWGAPRALSCSLRTLGQAVRDPRERHALLERAVEVVAGTGADLEEARSQLALGAALRREGKRSAAQGPLRSALDLADRCGALPLAARAREELIAVGVRPRRARLSGPGALTPSERRVARLAAEGLTNREIAEALFVTRKAVEYHLGNVYRKLDTRTRSELGALLGPDGDPLEV